MLPNALVSRIRVCKGKEWQVPLSDGQHFGHTGNWTEIDVVPPLDEMFVGEVDAQGLAQSGEVAGCRNLTSLVLLVRIVHGESLCDQPRITTRPGGPQSESSFEVEINYDAAEIE